MRTDDDRVQVGQIDTLTVTASGIGIAAALLIWFFVVRVYNVFGMGLGLGTYLWLAAVCVGICLAFSNLWDSTRRRKSIAVA